MIKIDNLKIGEFFPPAIIIDLGINHSGSLDRSYTFS